MSAETLTYQREQVSAIPRGHGEFVTPKIYALRRRTHVSQTPTFGRATITVIRKRAAQCDFGPIVVRSVSPPGRLYSFRGRLSRSTRFARETDPRTTGLRRERGRRRTCRRAAFLSDPRERITPVTAERVYAERAGRRTGFSATRLRHRVSVHPSDA